jgi:HSP20 family protein
MVMSRWDPFGEALSLRDAMNRLFEQAVLQPSGQAEGRAARGTLTPALDVTESAMDYAVTVSLPGVKPEDVDIQLEQGTVTISGEFKDEESAAQGEAGARRHHVRERRQGQFYRSISLPGMIEADKATATFEHGVLVLRLPKAQSAQPRRIPIQGTSGGQQQPPIEAAQAEQAAPPPVPEGGTGT